MGKNCFLGLLIKLSLLDRSENKFLWSSEKRNKILKWKIWGGEKEEMKTAFSTEFVWNSKRRINFSLKRRRKRRRKESRSFFAGKTSFTLKTLRFQNGKSIWRNQAGFARWRNFNFNLDNLMILLFSGLTRWAEVLETWAAVGEGSSFSAVRSLSSSFLSHTRLAQMVSQKNILIFF